MACSPYLPKRNIIAYVAMLPSMSRASMAQIMRVISILFDSCFFVSRMKISSV
jgi:hypothetical protein